MSDEVDAEHIDQWRLLRETDLWCQQINEAGTVVVGCNVKFECGRPVVAIREYYYSAAPYTVASCDRHPYEDGTPVAALVDGKWIDTRALSLRASARGSGGFEAD